MNGARAAAAPQDRDMLAPCGGQPSKDAQPQQELQRHTGLWHVIDRRGPKTKGTVSA